MLRNLCITAVLISLLLLGIRWSLEDQRIIRWADSRWKPLTAATVEYDLGNAYLMVADYKDAEIYAHHILMYHPTSPQAEDAQWMWLECLCITHHLSSKDIITECQNFLNQYPDGKHVPDVHAIIQQRQRLMSDQMDINPNR